MHIPYSYELIVYGPDQRIFRRMSYTGSNVIAHFFQTAMEYADAVINDLSFNNDREMTEDEEEEFHAATRCYLCGNDFDATHYIRVRHHHHRMYFDRAGNERSNYIGVICNKCNLNIKEKKMLTMVAHNGARYDWKFLLRFMPEEFREELQVLAKNSETFYQIIVGKKLRLIDSFRHMPLSLERLVNDLRRDGLNKFGITKQIFHGYTENELDLLIRKQCFPYK